VQFRGVRSTLKTLRRNIFVIVGAASVIVGLVLIFATIPNFRVATGSMEPRLPVGSVIFETSPDTLKPGDIITFQEPNKPRTTTHAFIGYADDGSLMTKGDANPVADTHVVPLTHDEVVGKVVLELPLFVPGFWLSPRGMLVIALVMMCILALGWRARGKIKEVLRSNDLYEQDRELIPV